MKILRILIICTSLLGVHNISYAADLTQKDLNQAASQTYSTADFMLNKAYQQLMEVLNSEEEKNSLKAAQKAWLKFRDLNVKFIAARHKGGSISPLIQSQALTEMTNNRTAMLTKIHLEAITP